MPMHQDYTPAQMTQLIDEVRDQIAGLAQAAATLVNNEQAMRKEVSELRGAHASWLAKLENDRAEDRAQLRELQRNVDALAASMGTVEVTAELEAAEAPPEVTISHDMLANGTWRYKTSVTMALGDIAEVASALENADQLARAEASRRAALDRDEAPLSRGLGKPKPEAIKTQLE